MNGDQSRLLDFTDASEPEEVVENMDEQERIEFIREHGNEVMKRGMNSVFGDNKYKPVKENIWYNEHQLDTGRKMVRTILKGNGKS